MGSRFGPTGPDGVESVMDRRWVGAEDDKLCEGSAVSDGNKVKSVNRGLAGHGFKA